MQDFLHEAFQRGDAQLPYACAGIGRGEAAHAAQGAAAGGTRGGRRGWGVVFGRNAIQVPDPIAFQTALCDVVKRGVSPAEAARVHGLKN